MALTPLAEVVTPSRLEVKLSDRGTGAGCGAGAAGKGRDTGAAGWGRCDGAAAAEGEFQLMSPHTLA